jgi:hypothetical protein
VLKLLCGSPVSWNYSVNRYYGLTCALMLIYLLSSKGTVVCVLVRWNETVRLHMVPLSSYERDCLRCLTLTESMSATSVA